MNKHTSDLSYLGAVMAFFAGLTWSDIASIAGILFGVGTFLVNWYYKQKDYELKKLALEQGQYTDEK